jgi:RHS repeat-associated protein
VDNNQPQYIAQSINYTAWGAPSRLENGCAGSNCADGVETYLYNNRLQPVVMQFGNPNDLTHVGCWAYNYYADVQTSSITNCTSRPAQGSQNNGNVMGYYYQDDVWVHPEYNHRAAYTYDAVNRLVGAVATAYGQGNVSYNLTFGYKADGSNGQYGNMSCVTNSQTNGPCPNWTFNSSSNQPKTSQGFQYDLAGHLTTDVSGLSKRYYAWDADGRLTHVTDSGGNTTTSYVYNALDQDVEIQTTGGQRMEQIFNPQGERLGYYDVKSGLWALGYVPWNGRELAKYAWTQDFNFHHPDLLGSGWMSATPAAAIIQDMHFYPWGQPWLYAEPAYDTHFAKMHASLQGSNLIDWTMLEAAHRFYAPSLGRWHSPDPAGKGAVHLEDPQTWNMYAYVRNNPTTLTDPSGLIDCSGKNAHLVGCQYLLNWDKEHGISPTAKRSEAPGVPVKLPNGKTVPDRYSKTGLLMSPTADLSDVAAAGKAIKKQAMEQLKPSPGDEGGGLGAAFMVLYSGLKQGVSHNGDFDYQRVTFVSGDLQQLPQFRDVSNFNVGLLGQQAGLSQDELLTIAGNYARTHASNYRPDQPYGLDPQTYELTVEGYQFGASGAYGP